MKDFHFCTDKGTVFTERFKTTIRGFLRKPVFLKVNAEWQSEVPSVKKKYHNTTHHSIKKIPIEASKKINEKTICSNLQDKEGKSAPKHEPGD